MTYVLVMLGLAAKVGWAPIHNWLPDAHSEAPAPISAMLSSALLPVVMLLAWRLRDAAFSAIGSTANTPLFGFGLLSVAVAIPFLWQPLAWKRLLAYSSLEHMGIIAVGIAFTGPLALAGVVVHVAGHALAKSLGFYAAISLYEIEPNSARHRATGLTGIAPGTSFAMIVSAFTLAGLPPAPLFVSEVLIVFGGIQTGHVVLATILAIFIALAFLGMLIALLALVEQRPPLRSSASDESRDVIVTEATGVIAASTTSIALLLIAVSVCGWLLVSSDQIARWGRFT
jgi:hydrogenase-4 component F